MKRPAVSRETVDPQTLFAKRLNSETVETKLKRLWKNRFTNLNESETVGTASLDRHPVPSEFTTFKFASKHLDAMWTLPIIGWTPCRARSAC
jgi:hypothetical protein